MIKASPVNQVLLTIDQALQDTLITDSGLAFYIDPSYRKEWCASVTATIADLPLKVNSKDKHIFDQLSIGDTVAISYRVVANFTFGSDGGQFMSAIEDNPHMREFVNGKGEWVKVYALPKRSGLPGIMWVGTYTNKKREFIDGVQGSEEEVERWLSQFPLGKTDRYTFNNFFEYNGKKYWKADLDDIFAIKRKGQWVAVGNRVICKPVEEVVPEKFLIDEHKGHKVKIRHQDRGRILSGGKAKGLKKDQIVGFDPRHLERYTFENKEYYLINENFVTGIWN